MSYDDAFTLGSKVDGYIKCTFVMLHTPEYGKVFALQSNHQGGNNAAKEDLEQSLGAMVTDNADAQIWFTREFPIIEATEYVKITKKGEQVPVKLTAHAAQIIANRLDHPDGTKWYLYRTRKSDLFKELIFESWTKPTVPANNSKYRYELEFKNEITPEYQMLIEAIQGNDITFYVKPQAVDWIPTNLNNFVVIDENGNPIRISDKLDEAKKKVNEAKAVLAAAGVATVIL